MFYFDSGDFYGKIFKEKVYLVIDIVKSVMVIMLEVYLNIYDYYFIFILEV